MTETTEMYLTKRPTVGAMEERMGVAIPCLDHGFVRLIDYMGDDAAIVQAARVSYGRGTKTPSADRALIDYLMRSGHSGPFEMAESKWHMKMPIFVGRQLIRHRTASVNETSARYSILDREFYLPAPADLAEQATTNKQGRGEALSPEDAAEVLDLLRNDATRCYDTYERLLNDDGEGQPRDPNAPRLARELARMNLTLNTYTQWYWKIDLHNLLHFLRLRMDPHAQYEARVYANAIGSIVQAWVPFAWEAFEEHRLGAVTLSASAWRALLPVLRGEATAEHLDLSGLPKRERADLLAWIASGSTKEAR